LQEALMRFPLVLITGPSCCTFLTEKVVPPFGQRERGGAGNYYVLMRTLLMNRNIGQLKGIIIKIQHHCRSDRIFYNSRNPFLIPIKHEYCLIFQK
jgi:hypothetical protein